MDTNSSQNSPDIWKKKFFDLFEEHEIIENSYQKKEELLCKTITRISHVTQGFSTKLAPYLKNIQDQISTDINTEHFAPELEKFSKAVMELEDTNTLDSTFLFDFLVYHRPDLENDFKSLKEKFEKNQPNQKSLFKAIVNLISSIQQKKTSDNSRLSENLQLNTIDTETVKLNLHRILDESEIPAKFESKVHSLKHKLHNDSSLTNVLDETVSLLFEIKKHQQSEQQDLTSFLGQVTQQLADLSIKASGSSNASKTSAKKTKLLDQSVSSQFSELKKFSESATELEPLKQLIHTRLENISQEIHNHRVQEQLERNQAQNELEDLSLKINTMEKESCLLKDKLVVAHKKAIHDPLTGLPNRLAYDNQLVTELSRWKRYNTPLSIIIWDIDYFKKINDSYGHKAGDKTLILIAKLLSKHCRETDFVSRFGGEEFTMLLSNTDAESTLLAANKIRKIIEKTAFTSNGTKLSITISCGITQFTKKDTGKSAFDRADKALYLAKNKGRNQCVIG